MSEIIKTSPLASILNESAELAQKKFEAYGNTYDLTGEIISKLWPDGINIVGPCGASLYSVITWIVGKLCRFAKARTHEARLDSLRDLVVYAAMAYEIYKRGDDVCKLK